MSKALKQGASANEPAEKMEPDISNISFFKETENFRSEEKWKKEVGALVAQIFMAGKKRGRPKKEKEDLDDEL